MANAVNNWFEIERRIILFKPTTTMPDLSQLGYDGDPNSVVDEATPGQTLLYNCPAGTLYLQGNGDFWRKKSAPNTWVKIGGESATDSAKLGAVFIKDIVHIDGYGTSVGEKVYKTGSNDNILVSGLTDNLNVRVSVIAMMGPSNLRPNVNVNTIPVGNWNYEPYEDGEKVLFTGYADILLTDGPDYLINAVHEDGAEATATLTYEAPPVVNDIQFAGTGLAYPGSQTEVKAGDIVDLTVGADTDFVAIEVADYGVADPQTVNVSATSSHTFQVTVKDSGDVTAVFRSVQVRVQRDNGSWSDWFDSNDPAFGTPDQDEVNVLYCNNLYPTVETIEQADITYPVDQQAIKTGESATMQITASDFTDIVYSSPNGQLTIDTPDTYAEDKVVTYLTGDYNVTVENVKIVATRAANGSVVEREGVVFIANAIPEVSISLPESRLRSGGNDGTSAQDHEVTITSNQRLIEAPDLDAGAAGTFIGAGFVGANNVWTRDLQVHDDDVKGTYTFVNITAKNLAGVVTTVITSGENYTLGGFVSRIVELDAFKNTVQFNSEVVDYTKMAINWDVKALTTKRAVGVNIISDPTAWSIDALNINPTTIVILDTEATGAQSQASFVTVEETV